MEQEEDKEEEKSVQEKKPYFTQFTIKTVVYLTSLLIFGSISMAFYCNYEGWSPGTAFGFAVVTLSTVGEEISYIDRMFMFYLTLTVIQDMDIIPHPMISRAYSLYSSCYLEFTLCLLGSMK